MASALDDGVITPTSTYYDKGYLTLNGRTIRNWDLKAHGQTTMTQVIEKSLNTGSAYVGRQLGKEKYYNYLTKFGFTKKTNIQLSDEVVGNIEPVKKTRSIHLATASFGQGISVTPIALINAVAAIANKGMLMQPNLLQSNKPQKVRRVVSEKAAQEITTIMTSAVKKARVAQVAKYKVAGKTGTAQVPDFKKGGYTDDVINTYVGFAPSSDAQFVILFRIDKPLGAPLAGQTVVPAFRELAEFILNYYNIAPDNLPES
jgi:cell division protein FtsI/penicillin-binding protein 2